MKKLSRNKPKSFERNLLTLAVASCFATEAAVAAAPVLPTGPTVINGQVFFNHNGNLLQITNTPGAVINWQGFSIGANEITRFIQQSASSAVLNRVAAGNPSVILGALQSQLANGATGGRVFLINPSGVVFGAGAQINTGGLVVSTLALSDADFLGGRNRFTEVPGAGGIVNQGKITTPNGGSIYLIASKVTNSGIIKSDGGQIVLAAGKSVEIVASDSPDIRVTITAPDNEAVNLGQIIAQGGKVGIYGGLVRQGGVVNANTAVRGENGKIVFKATKDVTLEPGSTTTASGTTAGSISIQADTGKATIAGVVEANATQSKGGTVTVAGQQGVAIEPTGSIAANGADGGSVALVSSAGSVIVAGPVSANATSGRAGDVEIIAATNATLAPAGLVSASGGQGGGNVAIKGGNSVALNAGSRIAAAGVAGGTVVVQSEQGTVVVQGTIDAVGTEGAGGNVEISAAADITLDDASRILVGGNTGGGAKVRSDSGTLTASGLIDGQGNDGPGGQVWLLAPRVGLVRQSVVNASGRTGGGTILVGGDYQGNNPEIPNAEFTSVSDGALLRADAGDSGNGGRVIVWSDDTTQFFGNISARGGASSGKGGLAEISGKQHLRVTGFADLQAADGSAGTLLLDPGTVMICHLTSVTCPTTQSGNDIFSDDYINAQLALGNLLITTANGSAGPADINFVDNTIAISWSVNRNLTLTAGRDINVQGSITWSHNNADAAFNAGRDITLNYLGGATTINGSGSSPILTFNIGTAGAGGTFNFNGTPTVIANTININGGTGTDTLIGPNAANTWTVSGSNAGSLNGRTFTSVENLTGGSNTDSFTLAGGTLAGTINGGGGVNTLTGDNVANTWTITGPNSGTLTGTGGFSNIQNLTGGSNTDSFTLAGGTLAGAINGGLGANTLTGDNVANTWTITSADTGTLTGTGGFSSIQNLTGGSNTDSFTLAGGTLTGAINGGAGANTLTGDNVANTWTITALNTGTLTGTGGFSSIQNLTGGTNTDSFTFGAAGSLAGLIDGGLGADSVSYAALAGPLTVTVGTGVVNVETLTGNNTNMTLAGGNVANTWSITGPNSGTVTGGVAFTGFVNLSGGSNTDSFTLAGGTLAGTINGGGGVNTLTGDNVANTWTITALNTGTLTGTGGFSNIQNLTGGSNTDSFTLAGGTLAGAINGGLGANTLTGDNVANTWTITSADTGTLTGTGGFSSIQNLTSGSNTDSFTLAGGTLTGTINGGGGVNTLTGDNVANTWTITALNTGTLTGTGGFSSIQNLSGGSNTDSFTFGAAGSLAGLIDGGLGADSVSYAALAGPLTVTVGTGVVNVETLTGNNTNMTLAGGNVANTWSITGANSGTVTGGVAFTGFVNLSGGSNTDSFTLAGGTLAGTINGGGGVNTLAGDNVANTWTITGPNSGTLTGTGGFSNIQNLTGGSNTDSFTLAGGTLAGAINGGLGANTLTGDNVANTWTITSADTGTLTGTGGFSSIQNIVGGTNTDSFTLSGGTLAGTINGGGGVNTLTGDNVANTWTITALNTGTLTGTGGFSNIQNLTGGSNTDSFTLAGGTLAGAINGGGGANTLTGDNVANTWTITSADTGTLTGTGGFSNIQNVVGGSNTDSFTLVGGTLTGTINGGAGVNTLTGDNVANTWTITGPNSGTLTGTGGFSNIQNLSGGSNTDSFTLAGGTLAGTINGGGGVNTLAGDNVANTWTITGPNSGTLTGTGGFSNIQNLSGGSNTDIFTGSGGSITGALTDSVGTTTLNSTLNLGSMNVGTVTLGSNTTLNASGAITLSGTVDGGFALALNTAGATTFLGAVGNTTPLASIASDAAGTTVINGGLITTSGLQQYSDAVFLGAATTLTSTTAGAINLASSVDGAFTLAVNTAGLTTLSGAVGGGAALASVTTDAAGTLALNGGSVTTTGAQTYNDPVILGAGTTLISTGAGNIAFNNTLNGGFALAVNTAGTTAFNNIVGGTTRLTSLTTDAAGGTTINTTGVNTAQTQTYLDAVTLSSNMTVSSLGAGAAGDITFNNTLNGGFALAVNTAGTTAFNNVVGGTTRLTSLTTDAPGGTTINTTGVNTAQTQTYLDAVTLSSNTTLSSLGAGAAGDITFNNTLNGGFALAVNTAGTTAFNTVVGGGAALASVTTDAAGTLALNGGSVTTTGAQTYNDPLTLGAGTTLISTGAGNITFNNTLNGGFALAVNTAGTTAFNNVVGGTTRLTSLMTDAPGGTTINTTGVNTAQTQTYLDAVTLSSNTALSSLGAGAAGDITFNNTVNGGFALAVNTAGTTAFNNVVGGTTRLTSLTTDAPGGTTINTTGVNTAQTQTYLDAVTLSSNTTLSSLGAGAAGDITFNNTLNGGFALAVNTAGTTAFNTVVGGGAALASVTTDAAGTLALNGGSVTTTGAQTYNDPLTLSAGTTLISTGAGNIAFNNTLNGGFALAVNTAGTTAFNNVVGGTTRLTSLTTDAPGGTTINTTGVNTAQTQTYLDAVTLSSNMTVSSLGAGAAGDITFNNTLNGGFALGVNTAGTTAFNSVVGGATRLTSLTTDSGGSTVINGGSVQTTDNQTYGDTVTINAATTFNATSPTATVAFNAPALALQANAHALTISADEIDFGGGVNSVRGTSTIQLQPNNPNAAIWLGTAADIPQGPHANELDLTTADLAALKAGFTAISPARPVIVGQNSGTHTITIGTSTFLDSALIQAPAGGGNIQWYLGGGTPILSAPNIDLNVPGQISGGGIINAAPAGSLRVIQSGGIGTLLSPLVTHVGSIEASNSGSGDVFIQNDRDVVLVNQFVNTVPGQVLYLETNGSIDTGNAIVSIPAGVGRIILTANDNSPLPDLTGRSNVTVGPGGITSNGGKISLHAADNVFVNGMLDTSFGGTGGNIEIIAGGVNPFVPGLLGALLTLKATELNADTFGSITLNALSRTGTGAANTRGDMVLISTTHGNSILSGAIGQTANGTIEVNNLTAVTLRGSGGSGFGGGEIKLNVASTPGLNSTSTINLYACAQGGCPDTTAFPKQPFTNAPMVFNQGLTPPLAPYADGPISYTDIGGTVVSGVGTVNDFTFFTPGVGVTPVNGSTLVGRNVTLETPGSFDINLASKITASNIVADGTLKFVAGTDINYNDATAGMTFGDPTAPGQNGYNLSFNAAGNVNLGNSIYVGPVGSLVVNANSNVTFTASTPANQMVTSSGTGDVTMSGNHEIRVGGNLTLNARDLNLLGGESSPAAYNQNAIGQQLNVAGALTVNLARDLNIMAGPATYVVNPNASVSSGSAAIIDAGSVAITAQKLTLTANDGGAGKAADAKIISAGNITAAIAADVAMNAGTATGTGTGATAIQAGNDVNLGVGGNLALIAGPNSSSTITGSNITIGSAAARVHDVTMTGGGSNATGATNVYSDALIKATGSLSLYASGNLSLTGGSAINTSAGPVAASAVANLEAGAMVLDVSGNVSVKGGPGTTPTPCDSGGVVYGACAMGGIAASALDIGANASANVLAHSAFSPMIGGTLSLTGGTASAGAADSHASAAASIRGEPSLNVAVLSGDLNLQAGAAFASGSNAIASASALLSSDTRKDVTVFTGKVSFTGGTSAAGAGGSAAAIAGMDAGNAAGTLETLTNVSVTGTMTLTSGRQSGPSANSSAIILSRGGIKITSGGLVLNGDGTSGLFQNFLSTGTVIRLDGSVPPVSIVGPVAICPLAVAACSGGGTFGTSFILSGAPPSNLDPLSASLLSSLSFLNNLIRTQLGTFLSPDSKKDKNYCS